MPIERASDHPTFELGGNEITSLAAPSRGAEEAALFRIDVPPGGAFLPHRHDHLDVFVVATGGGIFHLDEETVEIAIGDSVVVPIGVRHFLEAGPDGASLIVAMHPRTLLMRDDGSEVVPPWVV